MLTLCFFKVILNKFFLQKTVVYSKFTSCSGCKFLGFSLPKYFHVLHLSSALSATCSRKKSGKGFLSKFGGFSALRPAIRANAHLNAALEMLRENRTFSARKCTRRCSSGGCGLSVQLIQIQRREICRRRHSAGSLPDGHFGVRERVVRIRLRHLVQQHVAAVVMASRMIHSALCAERRAAESAPSQYRRSLMISR